MAVAIACLILGLIVGIAAVALHAYWWGLTLAVVAVATTAYALPAGWWARIPFALGCAAMVAYLALPRGEGDYVIAGDLAGYLLLGSTLALAVAAMVTLRPTRGGESGGSEESSLG